MHMKCISNASAILTNNHNPITNNQNKKNKSSLRSDLSVSDFDDFDNHTDIKTTTSVDQNESRCIANAEQSVVSSAAISREEPQQNAGKGHKKPKKKLVYTAAFEEAWQDYLTDPNMSKKEAFSAWQKLDDEEKIEVSNSIPNFSMYCKDNPEYRPVHMCRFIKNERFKGFKDGYQRSSVSMRQGTDPPRTAAGMRHQKWVNFLDDHCEKLKAEKAKVIDGKVIDHGDTLPAELNRNGPENLFAGSANIPASKPEPPDYRGRNSGTTEDDDEGVWNDHSGYVTNRKGPQSLHEIVSGITFNSS
ncbi:hypothetical protein B488_08930 [Liberibacter crescens BT-1]|uniref:Uncharacterized protein n=2 Tax=Liberibacter crescens TaxID=1273132 RepID=L0EVK2_LIBCB|nr:hypothetical protein B488_08930 [Liberibacter crescens BT-1]